jgi:hypothetical protein
MTLNQPIPAETCRNEADSIGKNLHKALRISNLGSTDENQPTTLNLLALPTLVRIQFCPPPYPTRDCDDSPPPAARTQNSACAIPVHFSTAPHPACAPQYGKICPV